MHTNSTLKFKLALYTLASTAHLAMESIYRNCLTGYPTIKHF